MKLKTYLLIGALYGAYIAIDKRDVIYKITDSPAEYIAMSLACIPVAALIWPLDLATSIYLKLRGEES